MGTGASKEPPPVSLMPDHQKDKKNTGHTWTSKTKTPRKGHTGATDVLRISLSKLGFSPSEITINKGQTISIHWSCPLGSNGHNVRQVVFDGQAVHTVQGGYNSGLRTSDGNFDIQFNLPGEFTFISDGNDANSGKVLHVKVNQRNYITAELADDSFIPSVLHIQQGCWVKWAWNSIANPRCVTEVKLCPKHCGILKTTGRTSVPTQSGSYKHQFLNPGLYYFQSEGTEDLETQLCIVHVQSTQQHHCVEVTDRRFNPKLLTISQGDRVWWMWDRFKCKKKHRIQQMELPTGQTASDPFPRPVKGGFSSDAPSRAGMLSHVFKESGVYYYCDNNYEDNREYLGMVIVKPRVKEHHIEVTAEGFYPDLYVVSSGDWIWWRWDTLNTHDRFSIMQVDSCVASDTKSTADVDCNNFCVNLSPKACGMLSSIGVACVQWKTAGVYHYRVSDTPATVGCCSVIVNPGQQDHCITVSDSGFDPKVLRIHPEDRVWWVWEDTKQQHNIIQVSRHGHPTKDGFLSGQPQDSPAAFVNQFSDGRVVYYQSAALPKLYGAVVAVPQAQVHQVLVSKNHLQPDPVLAQTYDCVAWVWPMLRKHGLTQLTNTQQVFELQTYTQDIVTPRRCCALRFSNPGVYHYYSKAFSNKIDKFMYEHSSKTVLSSVVVSNPSGPVTVLVSCKGFKPPAVSIHKGQSVLWSWKGSQLETHNIVHANPPTHERPYSPVTGPLAFSSGNPEPNNSFLFTFEEPGAYFETSEGAPGCVGVVNVLDNESLASMPFIMSSSNGGVVEHCHTVELQSNSESAGILYTLDGSIPELHGSATRVYRPERGIVLKQSGLHIIRAIAISSGALPSDVFTSKRFWVLEGNVNTSSADDGISIATDDFDNELQNHGPGPSKWQWYNCVPSISGWLHSASDSSIEIHWDLPSIPYRGELESYQVYVNAICYHNDLPPTCHSIAVEGLAGNQTYIIYIVAQPKDSTLQPHESNRLQVSCPTIYELGGPILSCQTTDKDDTITLVWTSLDDLFAPGTVDYLVYVDGRERKDCQIDTEGKYKTCVLTLPERESNQTPVAVFVLALPGATLGETDGYLSNELHLTVPLCLDNMHVLTGGSLSGKLYLTITEGSGKAPDGNTILLPTVEHRESFSGSVSTLTQGNTPQESCHPVSSKRSLECEETFNNSRSDSQTNSQERTNMNNKPDDPLDEDTDDNSLPSPVVSVRSQASNAELHIRWQTAAIQHSHFILHHYIVCVEGSQFDRDITSHSRQDVSSNDSGMIETQHTWNAGRGNLFVPSGLSENTTYRITVHGMYHHKKHSHQYHTIKKRSKTITCTTGGQPQPPEVRIKTVGLQEATLSWLPGRCHEDINILGYQLTHNGKTTSEIIAYGKMEAQIKHLQPGTNNDLTVSLVTTTAGQTSASNLVIVTCPDTPEAPVIKQESSSQHNGVVIVWARQRNKQLSLYRVFVNGKLHGEVKAKLPKKYTHHKYGLRNLKMKDDCQYNVMVKAYAGWTSIKKDHMTEATCGILSAESNHLRIVDSTTTQEVSLDLKVEGIHAGGIDVAWTVTDEDKIDAVMGFIILKDGHPDTVHVDILPNAVTKATLSNIQSGSTLSIQILAVTQSLSSTRRQSVSSAEQIEEMLRSMPPNSILQSNEIKVDYGCLVQAPSRVWCELVTGHSVMAVWDTAKKPRNCPVSAEKYIITWRKMSETSAGPSQTQTTSEGLTNDKNGVWTVLENANYKLNSATGLPTMTYMTADSDDHLLIDGLEVGTEYHISVQAWIKHTQHTGLILSEYSVPVMSEEQSLTVNTASPPEPPSKLTAALVSSHTVQLTWCPPREKGAEVRGLRIYVTTQHDGCMKTLLHMDLLPDATSAIIKHLQAFTCYSFHLVTIMEEFLYQANPASAVNSEQSLGSLSEDWNQIAKDSPWLPCVSIVAMTRGDLPPSNLSCDFDEDGIAILKWTAPEYDGRTSTVRKYKVQWMQVKNNGVTCSSDTYMYVIEISKDSTLCRIPDLVQGNAYCCTVSAVISGQDSSQASQNSKKKSKKRSHVAEELTSEPCIIRVPAPCIAPDVVITGFGPSWLDLYWQKPVLMTHVKHSDDPVCSKCIRRILMGYRLQVNGTIHAYLQPSTQQYRLHCTEAQSYQVVLAVITTTDRSLSRKLSIGNDRTWLGSTEVQSLCDVAISEPICFTLPKQLSGNIVELSGKFHPSEKNNQDADKNNHLQGDIQLEWSLQQEHGSAEEQGIMGYHITWSSSVDGEERVTRLGHIADSYDIPVFHNRCLYDVTVRANQYDEMWQDDSYPSIQCVVPGPPDPPTLCCTMATQDEFILEWGEPRMYGGVTVRGYQVYMNGRKIGQELNSSHYKAAIPCRPNRTYHMNIVALSADPNYQDSDLSEEVVITCWSPETYPQEPSKGNRAHRGQDDGCCGPEDISITVENVSETSVALEWSLPLLGLESQELVKSLRVAWSSVAKPQELEVFVKPFITQHTIRDCSPGTNHFFTVTALDESNRVLHRSRQLTVQTTAQLTTPLLKIRSCTYSGCILEWDKPMVYGKAQLVGYRLRLNGRDHDLVPAGAASYLFTSGKMCKTYSFTIQALCSVPHLHSPVSEPVKVTWPGVIPPALNLTTTSKLNAIKVTWPEPKVTGGVKVQHYKVTCIEESSTGHKSVLPTSCRPLKTHGPLNPDQRSAEFLHLSPVTAYTILLETHVTGVGKAIRSRPMRKQYAARRPMPPCVQVTVQGLDERRALEMEACQLVNMRHRILQDLISYQQGTSSGQPLKGMERGSNIAEIAEALATLAEIEDQLFQVLETLLPYTGTMSVDLEWQMAPSTQEISLSGFKILVNGKQHGFDLHANLDRISLQLSAYDGLHKISVLAVTDHPVGNSDPSNVVVVDASPFLPFTCYCLHSVHRNSCRHPQEGCCSYQQTLAQEVSSESSSILTGLHQSLDGSSRRIPPASIAVMDVFDRVPQLLISTKTNNSCPTLLLFWTHWCLASQKTMDHFVQYAKNRAGKVTCVTCCCNGTKSSNANHLQALTHQIDRQSWRDDHVVRHTCSCNVNDVGLIPGCRVNADKGQLPASSVISVSELFGVQAIPTIIVLHPEGYMAWQGCYASYDHSSFSDIMDDTVESVMKTTWTSSTHSNPKLVSQSVEDPKSSFPAIQSSSNQRPDDAPPSRSSSISAASSQLSGSTRRVKSAVQQRKHASKHKMISVNNRPFTAGSTSGKSDSSVLF